MKEECIRQNDRCNCYSDISTRIEIRRLRRQACIWAIGLFFFLVATFVIVTVYALPALGGENNKSMDNIGDSLAVRDLNTDLTKYEKRGWSGFSVGFGVTIFASLAKGAFYTSFETCGIQAVLAVLGYVPSAIQCVAAFAVAALGAAISAGIGAAACQDVGWCNPGSSGEEGKRSVNDMGGEIYLPGLNITLPIYEEGSHDYADMIYGHPVAEVSDVSFIATSAPRYAKRNDENSTHIIVFAATNGSGLISTVTTSQHFAASLDDLHRFYTGQEQLAKRDNGEWASYTLWGLNPPEARSWLAHDHAAADSSKDWLAGIITEQIQPCTDVQCYAVEDKFCLANGDSSSRTVDSLAVGEVYYNQYGGVDGECWDG